MSEPELFYPTNQKEWRAWLLQNHQSQYAVWILFYKISSDKPSITWSQAVDEALCFGWIDSKRNKIDDEKYKQYFTKRKPKSNWSKINKDKIEILIREKQMQKAGLKCIEIAQKNGSWTILDEVEALIVPNDLELEFELQPGAKEYFLNLSKSMRKRMLYWIVSAKKAETRKRRIEEIVERASQKSRPEQFRT